MAAVQLRSTILSHPGKRRPENEDYVDSFEPDQPDELRSSGCLYLVADGVGGESQGQVASRYAVQKTMYEYYLHPEIEPGDRLDFAIRKACSDLYQHAAETMQGRMATTLVAAVVREGRLTVANVGDSRAYLINNGKVRQITRDHNQVGELVRDGVMTEEEGMHSRAKNQLTRSVGGEADVRVDVFEDIRLQPGDLLLLCSDGLTRYALSADIARLTQGNSLEAIAQQLVEFANQSGGADNITVALVQALDPSAAVPPKTVGRMLSLMDAPEGQPSFSNQDESGEAAGEANRSPTRMHYIAVGITGLGLLVVGILVGSILANGWAKVSGDAPEASLPTVSPPGTMVCIASFKDNKVTSVSDLYKKFGISSAAGPFYVYRRKSMALSHCDFANVKDSDHCPRMELADPKQISTTDLVELPGISQEICEKGPNGIGFWLIRP